MDGIHDLGGMDGFGAVEPEPDEPGVPPQLGRPRVRHEHGDGGIRRLEHRHGTVRH